MTATNRPVTRTISDHSKRRATPAPRSSVRAWLVVGLLVCLQIVAFADKAVLGLVAPDAMSELGLTATQFGFIGSAFYFLYSIVSVTAGILASRFSVHWILLALAVVWAVMQFPMLVGGGAALLLATRIILGGAEGPATAMSLTSAHTWFHPSRRALPSNLIATGSTLGPVFAAPLLAWVIAVWGWRWAFGVLGIIGFVWVIAWLVFGGDGPYRSTKSAKPESSTAEIAVVMTPAIRPAEPLEPASATAMVDQQKPVNVWRAFFSVAFLAALIGGVSNFWVQGFLTTWLPQYLGTVVGLSLPEVGIYTTFPWLFGAVVLLVLGWAGHRMMQRGWNAHLGIALPFGVSTTISGIAFLLVPVSTGTLSVVFLTIAGGCSLVYPMAASAIGYAVGPKQRPILMATLGGFSAIGAIISPVFVGYLMTSVGYTSSPGGAAPTAKMVEAMTTGVHSAFLVTGILLVIAGTLAAVLLRPEKTGDRLQRQHLKTN